MQRMSGIATHTRRLVDIVGQTSGSTTRILDTRKTTPLFRHMEKWAVRIGGGHNHRMGLYDMVMLKDNHIDYAGGIRAALHKTSAYLTERGMRTTMRVEIEARTLAELEEILLVCGDDKDQACVHRIMLDNFAASETRQAVERIAGRYETEASGMITEANLAEYAATGVDFISIGALTHQVKSLDLSLKAC